MFLIISFFFFLFCFGAQVTSHSPDFCRMNAMYGQRRGLCIEITHRESVDSSIREGKRHRLVREQQMFEPCPHMYVEGCIVHV